MNIDALLAVVNQLQPQDENVIKYLQDNITSVNFKSGQLLQKAGEHCHNVYFVKKGAIRGFIKEGKKEITTWISTDNSFVTSISALDLRIPSFENMQAIEDCELLALTLADLEILYEQFPEFNIVSRKLLQRYYSDAERRAFIARLTNAETKYKQFLTRYSHFSNRIPLTYIASFLGITLETLSRVRRKLSMRKI